MSLTEIPSRSTSSLPRDDMAGRRWSDVPWPDEYVAQRDWPPTLIPILSPAGPLPPRVSEMLTLPLNEILDRDRLTAAVAVAVGRAMR